jgi:hypothetical protein
MNIHWGALEEKKDYYILADALVYRASRSRIGLINVANRINRGIAPVPLRVIRGDGRRIARQRMAPI